MIHLVNDGTVNIKYETISSVTGGRTGTGILLTLVQLKYHTDLGSKSQLYIKRNGTSSEINVVTISSELGFHVESLRFLNIKYG